MARRLGIVTGMHMQQNRGLNETKNLTPPGIVGGELVSSLGQLTESYEQERQAGKDAGLEMLKKVLKLFGPGYMKGTQEAALSGIESDFASRGLGKSTQPVAMSVGMKGQFEDMRRTKLADALSNVAQFMQQSSPSAPLVSSTAQAANLAHRQPGRLSPYMQKFDQRYGLPQPIGQ